MNAFSARLWPLSAAVLGLLVLSLAAFGHHGAAAFFDVSKSITSTGKVTEVQFINPHVQVYWEATNEKGVVEKWQGELTAPNKLARAGWTKRTLKPGDMVTFSGNPAKNGAHTLWLRSVVLSNGESLKVSED